MTQDYLLCTSLTADQWLFDKHVTQLTTEGDIIHIAFMDNFTFVIHVAIKDNMLLDHKYIYKYPYYFNKILHYFCCMVQKPQDAPKYHQFQMQWQVPKLQIQGPKLYILAKRDSFCKLETRWQIRKP